MQNPNITIFFDKSIVKQLLNFEVNFCLFNLKKFKFYFFYLFNIIRRNFVKKVFFFFKVA